MNWVRSAAYGDLGDAWLRHQTMLLEQRHIQYGRHFRNDNTTLLERAARAARAARSPEVACKPELAQIDRLQRATVEAINYVASLPSTPPPTPSGRLMLSSLAPRAPATEHRSSAGFDTIGAARAETYADIGSAWLRDQMSMERNDR